jgi:hypothetical protein
VNPLNPPKVNRGPRLWEVTEPNLLLWFYAGRGIWLKSADSERAFHKCGAGRGERAFFDSPAEAFYNESVRLDLIWGSKASELRDRLPAASTAVKKFRVL